MDARASRIALGKLLAAHRGGAGWTQRRLASEAFVDRSYVAHAESGRAVPSRHFWIAADDLLGAAGKLVAAFDTLDRLPVKRRDERKQDHSVDPRTVAERSLAFADRAVLSNVADETITHLQWEVSRLSVAYVHRELDAVFGDLVDTRDTLFGLLDGRQRPRHTRELYFLTGATCLLLAHGSQNLGDERAALAQLRCAWTCIDQADHPALRTWARGTAALLAEWSSQPRKAVEIATAGMDRATGAGRTRLVAIRGRAAARIGDHATARSAATVLADDPDDSPLSELDELGGLLTFPEAKRHYYVGGTLALTGDHDASRTHATRALDLYQAGPADARSYGDEALARIDLTRAHLHDGDLDGAAAALAPVLDLPAARRIRQLDGPVARIGIALAQGPAARDRRASLLSERIAHYHRTGPARALSSGA